MKKVLILAISALALTNVAEAQRAKVTQAENMLVLNKLDDAKTNIDLALEHEKTKKDVNTYLVASEVYIRLYQQGSDADGLEKAKTYMQTAIELDAKGNEKGKNVNKYLKKINEALVKLSGYSEGAAGEFWNKKDFKNSELAFAGCIWFNSHTDNYQEVNDTVLFINSGVAAMQAEDWQYGAEAFIKAGRLNGGGYMSYLRATYCYQQLKDSANIESTLKEGFERYPQEQDMLNSLINYYLQAQKNDEALAYLNSAIEKDPSNPQYYFARGCLKEKTSLLDAVADYKIAVEKDGKFYNALYNLGIAYFNLSNQKKRESGDYYKEPAKADALVAEANEYLNLAAPSMKTAADVAETTELKRDALKNLRTIYYQQGKEDLYAEVGKQIDALDAAN